MTHRERVIAVLQGKEADAIPCYNECPMDITVFQKIFPRPLDNTVESQIRYAEFFGNSVIKCGGIGLDRKTISKDDTHHTYRYETGSVWHESYKPVFCREAIEFPVNSPAEVFDYKMPDANDPERLNGEEVSAKVKQFKDAGYFVEGSVMGAWLGIYYYLTSFENILMWMASEPDTAETLFNMTRKFSIVSAKRVIACGVDCISTASDLGSGQGLLFSAGMFRKYLFPWLKELSDLCHAHGVYLHLHSHGHIQNIMDDIIEAGVDIINPVGPSDYNDLAMFKKRWGDKIVLHGGISTKIMSMTETELGEHVRNVISTGRNGSRFFPRTESGIPPMSPKKMKFYFEALHGECRKTCK